MMNLKAHRQRSDKRKQNEQCYLLALSGYHEPQVVKMELFTFISIMYYRKQFRMYLSS